MSESDKPMTEGEKAFHRMHSLSKFFASKDAIVRFLDTPKFYVGGNGPVGRPHFISDPHIGQVKHEDHDCPMCCIAYDKSAKPDQVVRIRTLKSRGGAWKRAKVHKKRSWMTEKYHKRIQKKWDLRFSSSEPKVVFIDFKKAKLDFIYDALGRKRRRVALKQRQAYHARRK